MAELKKVFRPEFLNRVDEVIVFHKLDRADIKQIVDLMIARLSKQLAERDVNIELTEPAKELLAEKGFDPAFGARPLRRAIQQYIEDLLADEVLAGAIPDGSTVLVDCKDENTTMKLLAPKPKPEKELIGAPGEGSEGGKPRPDGEGS
jgi:ATP-dependent Clp protease ATP-binding subunit ClpC